MSDICKQCGYEFNSLSHYFCEYCRTDYGVQKARYAQSEKKKVFSDDELENMTDGDFINEFGHTHFRPIEEETKPIKPQISTRQGRR
jgi:hypothetical protein